MKFKVFFDLTYLTMSNLFIRSASHTLCGSDMVRTRVVLYEHILPLECLQGAEQVMTFMILVSVKPLAPNDAWKADRAIVCLRHQGLGFGRVPCWPSATAVRLVRCTEHNEHCSIYQHACKLERLQGPPCQLLNC